MRMERGRYCLPLTAFCTLLTAVSLPTVSLRGQTPAAAVDERTCAALADPAAQSLSDSAENSARLYQCGRALDRAGERRLAVPVYESAVDMAKRLGDKPAAARALVGLGSVLRTLAQGGRAEPLLRQALQISEELQDQDGMATAYSELGSLRHMQARDREAREFHQRSYELWRDIDDPLGIAIGLNNVALLDRDFGDYVKALDGFQRSLAALERLGDRRRTTTVLDNIGLTYRRLGDFARGLEYTRRGLEIRESLNDREGIAKSLDSMSEHYQAEGDYPAALQALERSLKLRTEVGSEHGIAECLHNIALAYEALGNFPESIAYLRRSMAANRRVGDEALAAEINTRLGELFFAEGDFVRAARALNESIASSERGHFLRETAAARIALGRVYLSQGRLRAAAASLERALAFYTESGAPRGRAEALIELAELDRRLGRHSRGLERANEARQLADSMELPEVRWRALTTVGRLNGAARHPDAAQHAFDEAIAVVEDLRSQMAISDETRSRVFADRFAPYQERIALALSRSRTREAFAVAERSKARTLLDVLRGDRMPITKAMTADERAREAALRNRLSSLNGQLLAASQSQDVAPEERAVLKRARDAARLEYDDFQSALYAAHPELRTDRAAVPTATASESQRLVPNPATAIVEFVSGPQRTWAFVVTTSGIRSFTLPSGSGQLRIDVERYRRQLASRDLRAADTGSALFEEVLGPMREMLSDKTELIIVPDGVLWDLPFQALQPAAGRYLVEQAAISYAPSVTVLRETLRPRPEPAVRGTLLAFGNPTPGLEVRQRRKIVLMDDRLEPLPDAEVQVKQLGSLYGTASRVYVGADAREDRWKELAPHYQVLHLATHGVVDDRSPLYSYVVLAPSAPAAGAGGEDGLVEAREIMNVPLKADLVVLSACETARGRLSAGEGVIGLMWSFFVAGSPATLVSQWKVESSSSTALMLAFHRNWNGGARGVSKARALQQAAIGLIHDPAYSHPFYWSGYILVGNSR